MNNKKLFLILLVLLGIYGASQMFSGKKDRSFKTELITIDTAAVTSIVIAPKTDDFQEITLKKEGTSWIATQGTVTTKATTSSVKALLSTLVKINTERVAAKNESKWSDYEVGEGEGTRIKVYNESTLLEDFIVGRFAPNQQMQNGTSFVRIADESEVYAVKGFLSFTFNRGFDSFRDRSLLTFNPSDITYFSYQLPGDTVININKTGNQWFYETTQLDSTKVADYLKEISTLSGNNFADDFDEVQSADQLYKSITLSGNNMTQPIIVKSYLSQNNEFPYVLKSSQNPDGLFNSKEDGVIGRLFKNLEEFRIE